VSKDPLAGCPALVCQPIASGDPDAHGRVNDVVFCRYVERKSAL